MASITEQISADVKNAMKAKRSDEVTTLRMVLSDLKNKQIDKGAELTDEEVIDALSSMKKKRLESAEAYDNAGRQELADKERQEVALIERYLPEQISDEELERIVDETIREVGAESARQMGMVMGALMPKVKGRVDGSKVNRLVKKKLT